MIYIIDNGQSYEDHEIAFVEAPDGEVGEAFMHLFICLGSSRGYRLIGRVLEARWEIEPTTVGQLIGPSTTWTLAFYRLPPDLSPENRRALLLAFREAWLTLPIPEPFPADLAQELDDPDPYVED